MFYSNYVPRFDSLERRVSNALATYRTDDKNISVKEQLLDMLEDVCRLVGRHEDMSIEDLLAEAIQRTEHKEVPNVTKYGRVIFSNRAKDKCFGFIDAQDGQWTQTRVGNKVKLHQGAVWFHHSYGVTFSCNGGDEPALGNDHPEMPRINDILIYEEQTTKRGKSVVWWGYKVNWDEVVKEIADRPTYRLRRINGTPCWEGNNLSKLRLMYPKTFHVPGTSSDMSMYYFEQLIRQPLSVQNGKLQGDTWVKCADPR